METRFLKNIESLFMGKTNAKLISYLQLSVEYDMFIKKKFLNGVEIMKVYEEDTYIVFMTTIPKGKTFGLHLHDCDEKCYVVKGWLADKTTKETKIQGQVMRYNANVEHKPYAIEDTTLVVTFRNPNIEYHGNS